MMVVATISKFPSSAAFEAEPMLIPSIRNIGAAMSRSIIPTVYGKSLFVSLSAFSSFLKWNKYIMPTPQPAPRYKKASICAEV